MKKTDGFFWKSASILVLVFVLVGTKGASAATYSFNRTLSVGASGEDVLQLQKILNQDPETRISGTGPGSPGQETAYFGALTAQAVVRFQNKHARQILVPNGLSAGTGVVGLSTRLVLGQVSNTSSVASAAPSSAAASSVASKNPNLKNIDTFIASVNETGLKQGLSASQLVAVNDQIRKDAATSTDLRAEFLRQVKNKNVQAVEQKTFIGGMLATLERAFDRVFRPEKALAASTVPFGGSLYYAYFCTCSFTWLLGITPLPPSYAVLLSYVPFSEIYMNYNIPYTNNMVGSYQPGAGACLVYIGYGCLTIPSEGMITPIVGSSLI